MPAVRSRRTPASTEESHVESHTCSLRHRLPARSGVTLAGEQQPDPATDDPLTSALTLAVAARRPWRRALSCRRWRSSTGGRGSPSAGPGVLTTPTSCSNPRISAARAPSTSRLRAPSRSPKRRVVRQALGEGRGQRASSVTWRRTTSREPAATSSPRSTAPSRRCSALRKPPPSPSRTRRLPGRSLGRSRPWCSRRGVADRGGRAQADEALASVDLANTVRDVDLARRALARLWGEDIPSFSTAAGTLATTVLLPDRDEALGCPGSAP